MSFLKLVETIAIVKFKHVAEQHDGDAKKVYEQLYNDGLDGESLGFWVWDVKRNIEFYSPKFRSFLGYEGEHDFPSVPESWQKAITTKSLAEALLNFQHHVDTKGEHRYTQISTYTTKNGDRVKVDCHGTVVTWDGDEPELMIGVHLTP